MEVSVDVKPDTPGSREVVMVDPVENGAALPTTGKTVPPVVAKLV